MSEYANRIDEIEFLLISVIALGGLFFVFIKIFTLADRIKKISNAVPRYRMKISFESPVPFTPIAKALHILTIDASIYTRGIQYDSANGIVEIPMKRRTFIEYERKGGLPWTNPIYGQEWIDAVLIVRKVTEMETYVHQYFLDRCNSYFSVWMGLEIWDNKLYLGSYDYEGRMGAWIDIKVKEFDIEFSDRDDLELPDL